MKNNMEQEYLIQKIRELIGIAKETEGSVNIQIVLYALLGAIQGEEDALLAREVQNIVKEKLMPLLLAEKERIHAITNITYPDNLTSGINYN